MFNNDPALNFSSVQVETPSWQHRAPQQKPVLKHRSSGVSGVLEKKKKKKVAVAGWKNKKKKIIQFMGWILQGGHKVDTEAS